MENNKGYNGWYNYATWRVNLEFCADLLVSLDGEQTFESVEDLADYLEDAVDEFISGENMEHETNTTLAGWARAFIEDVDWDEIASHNPELIENAENDEEENDEDD